MKQLKSTHAFNLDDQINFDILNKAAHNYHIVDTMIKILLSRSESFELANCLIDSFLKATIPYSSEISKYVDAILYETENTENSENCMESN